MINKKKCSFDYFWLASFLSCHSFPLFLSSPDILGSPFLPFVESEQTTLKAAGPAAAAAAAADASSPYIQGSCCCC